MAITGVSVFTTRNQCQCNCIIVRGNGFPVFENHCDVGFAANHNLSEEDVLALLGKHPLAKVIFANFLGRAGCWEVQLAV
ncbi:MAG: hypothetical protein AAB969_01900 [Patescibacteria group bacterium]